MLKELIQQLIDHQDLSQEQCEQALKFIFNGAEPLQIAAFLVLLHAKPITATELYTFVKEMRKNMLKINAPQPLLDIVGTGGDGAQSVNISTAASIVAAACGAKVAKHGNRSVSSHCGSADFLSAAGVEIALKPEQVADCINKVGIGFCFAPLFNPLIAKLKPIRKALSIPTSFNLVGPLLNPAEARYYLLGVADKKLMSLMAEVLFKLEVVHALIVNSAGLDELTLIAPAQVLEVTPQGIQSFELDPKDYGFDYSDLSKIQGGSPAVNAQLLRQVFAGESSVLSDTIIFNAGVALYVAELVSNIAEGIHQARQALQTGRVSQLFNQWREYSHSFNH